MDTATKHTIELELNEAIQRQDFVLHYQPQVCFKTGRIFGAEALIRWNHPDKGIIPPSQFIIFAEASGLINPIGNWVINEAIRQAKVWKDNGLSLRVSINISARQFNDNLPQIIDMSLSNNNILPRMIEIELTESFLVDDTKKAIRVLNSLRSTGVSIALDDFGTGYSSLNYLKNFPVDTLKIDRSFIGEDDSDFDKRIIRALITIANEFCLTTLAEGVQTEKQRNELCELGCDAWQGFLFSKPLSAYDFFNLCQDSSLELAALSN